MDIEQNYNQNNNYYNNNSQYNNNQSIDGQNQYQEEFNQQLFQKQNEGLLGNTRLGFIRKVYLILGTQLLVTVLMTVGAMYSPGFTTFQQNNLWLLYTCIVIMFIVEIALFCFRNIAKTVPINYICLFIFTFCMSYFVSTCCSLLNKSSEDGQKMILVAAVMTFGIVVALTIYAFKTKTDFTILGGFLFCFVIILIIFGIFLVFTYSRVAYIVYSALGCLLYSLYLIYDTQLIIGEKKYSLDIDDYVIGALMLYNNIIYIFFEILRIFRVLSLK
ncbi:inhibitor of apoptosis-promoting Bax1 protein (macronuclear) [Tetrahymena thermophila SB210]|uniref:Inhibitor of apoptosis-promoting Bax1 protein n=1 Tax=Tetrahymena thermophila (strain SB210) TaxID=312017 RepID=Q22Y18_TETTS|nr:inhibitor of apoptosis-promoting Bax1 protein [Tetrahymena thermophila SB210]EAR90206.1 inhibitor of apoptosis-promoting Bax1 protein [Tetrahymena thermophila SB210]|eukprot:XP_001010451.1 inhibitor of apoptosis-promoting Bax1 protein [Tetrahymena thermophila SB210]